MSDTSITKTHPENSSEEQAIAINDIIEAPLPGISSEGQTHLTPEEESKQSHDGSKNLRFGPRELDPEHIKQNKRKALKLALNREVGLRRLSDMKSADYGNDEFTLLHQSIFAQVCKYQVFEPFAVADERSALKDNRVLDVYRIPTASAAAFVTFLVVHYGVPVEGWYKIPRKSKAKDIRRGKGGGRGKSKAGGRAGGRGRERQDENTTSSYGENTTIRVLFSGKYWPIRRIDTGSKRIQAQDLRDRQGNFDWDLTVNRVDMKPGVFGLNDPCRSDLSVKGVGRFENPPDAEATFMAAAKALFQGARLGPFEAKVKRVADCRIIEVRYKSEPGTISKREFLETLTRRPLTVNGRKMIARQNRSQIITWQQGWEAYEAERNTSAGIWAFTDDCRCGRTQVVEVEVSNPNRLWSLSGGLSRAQDCELANVVTNAYMKGPDNRAKLWIGFQNPEDAARIIGDVEFQRKFAMSDKVANAKIPDEFVPPGSEGAYSAGKTTVATSLTAPGESYIEDLHKNVDDLLERLYEEGNLPPEAMAEIKALPTNSAAEWYACQNDLETDLMQKVTSLISRENTDTSGDHEEMDITHTASQERRDGGVFPSDSEEWGAPDNLQQREPSGGTPTETALREALAAAESEAQDMKARNQAMETKMALLSQQVESLQRENLAATQTRGSDATPDLNMDPADTGTDDWQPPADSALIPSATAQNGAKNLPVKSSKPTVGKSSSSRSTPRRGTGRGKAFS